MAASLAMAGAGADKLIAALPQKYRTVSFVARARCPVYKCNAKALTTAQR